MTETQDTPKRQRDGWEAAVPAGIAAGILAFILGAQLWIAVAFGVLVLLAVEAVVRRR